MTQQFIELGQGYGDIYEICELIKTNKHRYHNAFIIKAPIDGKTVASLAVAFKPVGESKFMPIYICLEGIPYSEDKPSKRIEIFDETVKSIGKQAITFELKHSSVFSEKALYYQYVIGILRLNNYIPPLT